MPFIDRGRTAHGMTALAAAGLLALSGCGSTPSSGVGAPGGTAATSSTPAPTPVPAPVKPPARDVAAAPGRASGGTLPPAQPARNWEAYQRQAAQRLMAANRDMTYAGEVPEPLLAIPVLEIELERDGRVRSIKVIRQPTQALDTVQLAIDAVYRAAPFGDVSHLPRPWLFTEVFLFDDDRRFKPRTLDD